MNYINMGMIRKYQSYLGIGGIGGIGGIELMLNGFYRDARQHDAMHLHQVFLKIWI
ncbi:hypothetical protein [Serratia marcescens]|uniref:hypothetical protein n=1 Tax=Serratia marcescens TaxID=615 RepID=UPI001F070564|nr:hypothetical protein [Serratia marcescens]UMK46444.1 hypothetical protein L2D51_15455 [Serratia marcescens]